MTVDEPPPFPLTHRNLDLVEAELLAAIASLGWPRPGAPNGHFVRVIRWVDFSLLADIDRWRRKLLAQESGS